MRSVLLSPSECEAENARVKAKIENSNKRSSAKESNAESLKRGRRSSKAMEPTLSEQCKKQKKKGFKSIAFDYFLLDGKELAMRNTKHSIQGSYVKLGAVEFLMSSIVAIEMTRNEITTDRGFAFLWTTHLGT